MRFVPCSERQSPSAIDSAATIASSSTTAKANVARGVAARAGSNESYRRGDRRFSARSVNVRTRFLQRRGRQPRTSQSPRRLSLRSTANRRPLRVEVPEPMLFRQQFLHGLQNGTVTLAFRRWRRPSVKAGGTLLTAVGLLHIGAVEIVAAEDISSRDARQAGYDSREALLSELIGRSEGEIYRIGLGPLELDPRVALRQRRPSGSELEDLAARLARLDARASGGPWTRRVLDLLEAHPAVRAGDLCGKVGQDRDSFKLNVRKLKGLGLTESLETGYRLSPRGEALLDKLRHRK